MNSSSNESSDLSSNDSLEITSNQIRPPKKQQVIGSQKAQFFNSLNYSSNVTELRDSVTISSTGRSIRVGPRFLKFLSVLAPQNWPRSHKLVLRRNGFDPLIPG